VLYFYIVPRYGDGAGNIVEENYSVSTKNGPPKYNGVVFEILGKRH